MRIIVVLFFCVMSVGVSAQNDTLLLSGLWGKMKFDSTTMVDGQLITGRTKLAPVEDHYSEFSSAYPRLVKFYRAHCWMDSLKTEFIYTSLDTNLGDLRTIRSMGFYTGCKVKMNGSWEIDKASKTQVQKKYGESKYPINQDAAARLKWHTYHLYVNGTLCSVAFYFDYSGVLRKVTIESLKKL